MSVVPAMQRGSALVFMLVAVACKPGTGRPERTAPSASSGPSPTVASAPAPVEVAPFVAGPEVDVGVGGTEVSLKPSAKAKLWRALQALPSRVGDFDDRGCSGMLNAKDTLGSRLTDLRRRHRGSRYYTESLSCRRAPSGDVSCDAHLTINGPRSEDDLGVSVRFSTDADAHDVLPPVVCFLAG